MDNCTSVSERILRYNEERNWWVWNFSILEYLHLFQCSIFCSRSAHAHDLPLTTDSVLMMKRRWPKVFKLFSRCINVQKFSMSLSIPYFIFFHLTVVPSGILQPPFFYGDDIPRYFYSKLVSYRWRKTRLYSSDVLYNMSEVSRQFFFHFLSTNGFGFLVPGPWVTAQLVTCLVTSLRMVLTRQVISITWLRRSLF